MNISDRIKILIEELGLDSKTFATILKINPSSISHLTSGRNKPSFDFLRQVAKEFPQVNIDWLLTGKGEIFKNKTNNYVKQENEKENISEGIFSTIELPDEKKEEKTAVEKKQIDKIILLYTDGSFKIYSNEDI